ncbi:MAG TPA: type II secretion system F family protein [Blastocatellia bacterium]|nr:type II secretion system F family protein [Blastocatellia bacterium]
MEFVCRIGTPTGDIVTRSVEAATETELRSQLKREGFRVFDISTPSIVKTAKPGSNEGKLQIKLEDFLLFNQQLSALLRAGLPILQSIGILKKRQKNQKLFHILNTVEDNIKSGVALSDAFAQTGSFPRIYTASLLAGERAGSLDAVLIRYVNYTKGLAELRRKLKKALTYPAFLILASLMLVTVLTTYVIPKFSELFGSVNAKLPVLTEVVVEISKAVQTNLYWAGPLIVGIGIAFFFWRKTQSGRLAIDKFLLKLPIFGDLIRQSTTAQLTRSLATLLAGGITLLESYEIASEAINNRGLRATSASVMAGIREGRAFTDSMEATGWVPELALDMIGVGEKSGSLREMLDEVANFYDAELDTRMSGLTAMIEPVILIFMGGIVVTILLAMYLPLLSSVNSITG